MNKNQINKFVKKIQKKIRGTLLHEPSDVKKYIHDKSIYEKIPALVFLPQDTEDLSCGLALIKETGLPIFIRGGGSGTAGACLGEGCVIGFDRSSDFTTISGLFQKGDDQLVTASAGVIHETLQKYLRKEGYYLPADPSSGPLCMIGGNVATKASGPHALRHGSIDAYIESLTFVDHRGECVRCTSSEALPLYLQRGVAQIEERIHKNQDVRGRLVNRQNRKIASGYNLFTLLDRSKPLYQNVAGLLIGSVGTLGIVTEVQLRVEPYIPERATCSLYFSSLAQACEAVHHIRELNVAAIEIISAHTLSLVNRKNSPKEIPIPSNSHVLLVELEGSEIDATIEKIALHMKRDNFSMSAPMGIAKEKTEQERLWRFRKAILPRLLGSTSTGVALSVVNDVGVDPGDLGPFIERVEKIFKSLNLKAAVYGHAGSGNLHLRPLFDKNDPHLKKTIQRVADEVYETVISFKGTITAEHGMGPLRAPYLEKEWGSAVYETMKQVKSIFDPDSVFSGDALFSNEKITNHMKSIH